MRVLSAWLGLGMVTAYNGLVRDEVIQVPKWTEAGTIMVNKTVSVVQANSLSRGKTANGCDETTFFGLYDWNCAKGKRYMGKWTMKTKCTLYCRSHQKMMPKIKKITCKKNKKTGQLAWKFKKSWNPTINCVSMSNTARWSGWSAWSDWSGCSAECGTGQKIRQRVRNCIGGVMGEAVNCPHQGHVMQEITSCNNNCASPPEVVMDVSDIQDKQFKVTFAVKNVDKRKLSHFKIEVFRDKVEWNQVVYKIADFDMINKDLSEMHIWREVEPLTRYTVWVYAMDTRNKPMADPALKQIFTTESRFDYDESQMCTVNWSTTFKDAMVTSCDHMTEVPHGHRCYTYCKDDWRKMRGSEYMTCMGGKWRGSWPKCESRGWRCDFNDETDCPGCVKPPHCCDHIENEGEIRYICNRGYLRPEPRGDKGWARVLMKKIDADKSTCLQFKTRRRDCSLKYEVRIKALYTSPGKKPIEKTLADIANDPEWDASCRDDEDYDTNTIDVRPKKGYESVQIVFEAFLDRSNGQMGYDMWFDKFYHGYGRCSAMRCGPFPPPLLKGGGAAFGHDVGGLTCTKEDAVGSMCKMECPSTHPVGHFAHYHEEINCLPAGWWSQPLYSYYTGYCQAPSCNFFDVVPPENGWLSCSHQGYEGSVCTFGCNSIDYKLDNKTPYRIECKNYMWVPTGGPKGFVAGKTQAKCVFNHAFARMESKITKPLHPLTAMRRQYQELSGAVNASEMRRERTQYNVDTARERFNQKTLNYEQIFHSFFGEAHADFESNMESFNMDDHM